MNSLTTHPCRAYCGSVKWDVTTKLQSWRPPRRPKLRGVDFSSVLCSGMVFQWLGSLRRAFGTPFLLLVFLIYWTQVRSSFTQDIQPSCNWQAARLIKFDMLHLQTLFARLKIKYLSQSVISNTNSPCPHDWVRGSFRAFDHSLGQACLSSSRTS